jgi:hypothetical protein
LIALRDGVQNTALLFGGNRGILPNSTQLWTFIQQAGNGAELRNGAVRVEMGVENNIREGASVRAGNGSHP